MNNKEFTANQFNKVPAPAYRAAYDGETVTISHDHYGQGLFELTYRKRGFKPEKEQLTDEQKNALIMEMTRGSNDHLKFHFPEDLPGYAIIWQKEPHPVTGLIQFRWTNYAMRNGIADSFEECLQKAREHAKCQSK